MVDIIPDVRVLSQVHALIFRSELSLKGEQSALQMTPSDGSLRNEKVVGDVSGVEYMVALRGIAREFLNIRTETGAAVLEQKLEIIVRNGDPWKPEGGVRCVRDNKN